MFLSSGSQNRSRATSLLLLLVLLVVFSKTTTTSAEYLKVPEVEWTFQIPGGGSLSGRGFRKGNAVKSTKDGQKVFATADDGSVHIWDYAAIINNGEETMKEVADGIFIIDTVNNDNNNGIPVHTVYEPRTGPQTSIDCRSGISLHERPGKDLYALYAVVDVPLNEAEIPLTSRVKAINPDGTLRWTLAINGYVAGTPQIGTVDNFIYVVHNIVNDAYDGTPNTSPYRGVIKVIYEDDDGVDTEQSSSPSAVITASISSPDSRRGPFGPVVVQSMEIDGVQRDVAIVAENWDNGYNEEKGQVYALVPSDTYDANNGRGSQSFSLQVLSEYELSSATRPTVSRDGTKMWIGGQGAQLGGWGSPNNNAADIALPLQGIREPLWEASLETSARNPAQPLVSSITVSSDSTNLYLPGVRTQFYCLDAATGDVNWSDEDGSSIFMAEALLVEPDEGADQAVVYAAEHLTGTIRQYDAASGQRVWTFDCEQLSGIAGCQSGIEAEMSTTPSGNILYYGDIFGNMVALRVATFATSKPVTTQTNAPTRVPTHGPTIVPTTTKGVTTPTTTPAPSEGDDYYYDDDDSGGAVFPTQPTIPGEPTPPQPTLSPALGTSGSRGAGGDDDGSRPGTKSIILFSAIVGGIGLLLIPLVLFLGRRIRYEGTPRRSLGKEPVDTAESSGNESQVEAAKSATTSSSVPAGFSPMVKPPNNNTNGNPHPYHTGREVPTSNDQSVYDELNHFEIALEDEYSLADSAPLYREE